LHWQTAYTHILQILALALMDFPLSIIGTVRVIASPSTMFAVISKSMPHILVPVSVWVQSVWLEKPVRAQEASHKSNPSSIPRGIVDLYFTLPWIMWEALTVVVGVPWWGLLRHMLANGAVVYPSQGGRYRAEGCMALG
jgi:predicted small integral membrane protein